LVFVESFQEDAMGAELPDRVRRLLDGQAFVMLATINPDGSPQVSPVWAKRDGDDVLLSTVRGRHKTSNMERDPRVSVVVTDPADPYFYREIRGEAELTEKGGRELIDDLSMKYLGKMYEGDGPDAVRVVVRLTPRRVVGMG
jgi:PPOX class probable F420-dependent enzyme